MSKYVYAFFLLNIFFVVSCRNNAFNISNASNAQFLHGYWIPLNVKWEIEDLRYKDSSRLYETAHFKTLTFSNMNDFIFFGSTQKHQEINNDSIIFAGEPLITIFGGTWQIINDSMLKVDYRPIEYDINPPDKSERHEQIKIVLRQDTFLLFENVLYKRTDKYDKTSREMIQAYIKQYLK